MISPLSGTSVRGSFERDCREALRQEILREEERNAEQKSSERWSILGWHLNRCLYQSGLRTRW